ncbi:hypothetical protein [Weissella cibaria]|uniref:hypothetical protein n=1 Tax=Weissella cibaria TaxID=137591 RepID=UPI0025978B7E|nr:hypothetical protein [uncultured Weissella sp.]
MSVEERFKTVLYSDYLTLANADPFIREKFTTMLDGFSNNGKNRDVEDFLKHKAEQYDKLHFSKTYLVLNNDLDSISGYFSLASRSLIVKKKDWVKISKGTRKKLNPFGYREEVDQNIPAMLLGQFGRNFNPIEPITGDELLSIALAKADDISRQVGGRYLYLEADDHEKLAEFYVRNGFSYLSYTDATFHKTVNNQVLFIKKFS